MPSRPGPRGPGAALRARCVTPRCVAGGPKVYDVTKYMDDHPGGSEVLLDHAGKYADEMFEDIGHSGDARQKLKELYIGDLAVRPCVLAE
jgi:cytochrome b involved in lipid metabolism